MIRAAILCALAALPAAAQAVGDCDWRAAARNLPEPWDATAVTRTFANGEVRLAILDTIEPAAGALYLMILSPPYDELDSRQCRIVGASSGMGFGGMTLDGMEAAYDPARGLVFAVPVHVFQAESGEFEEGILDLTLNQSTGEIGAGLR